MAAVVVASVRLGYTQNVLTYHADNARTGALAA